MDTDRGQQRAPWCRLALSARIEHLRINSSLSHFYGGQVRRRSHGVAPCVRENGPLHSPRSRHGRRGDSPAAGHATAVPPSPDRIDDCTNHRGNLAPLGSAPVRAYCRPVRDGREGNPLADRRARGTRHWRRLHLREKSDVCGGALGRRRTGFSSSLRGRSLVGCGMLDQLSHQGRPRRGTPSLREAR